MYGEYRSDRATTQYAAFYITLTQSGKFLLFFIFIFLLSILAALKEGFPFE
jgi:hypothetical protein